MIRRYLKPFIPVGIRTFISKIEGFLLFNMYAYRILGPYLNKQLRKRQTPSKYLFIVSPARSGSSLLGHVLCSHSEIAGYGESHVGYASPRDLTRLVYRTATVLDDFDPMGHRYVVDKLVWNYPITDNILQNTSVKFIFLLRDPAATYMSTVKSFSDHESPQEVDKWMTYYQGRLGYLKDLASRVNDPQRCVTLKYEDFLSDPQPTLRTLQLFLDTTEPFSEHYRAGKHTSRLKYGDNSKTIQAGRILRQKFHRPPLNSRVFHPEKQEIVYHCYESCMETLQQYTQTGPKVHA